MNVDELKLRAQCYVDDIIDILLPQTNVLTNIGNTTARFYVEQNLDKLDEYLCMFADKDRNINTDRFLEMLEMQVFKNDQVRIDVSQYLPEKIRIFIPKQIIITKEDFYKILGKEV